MKFGRKSKARSGGGASRSGGRMARQGYDAPRAVPERQLNANRGSGGMPGSAGYPNGPNTALPTFFETRRPDGRPEKVIKKRRFFG
jgi:hypothetical protein